MNRRPGSRKRPSGKTHEYRESGHDYCAECGLIKANWRHDTATTQPAQPADDSAQLRLDIDG